MEREEKEARDTETLRKIVQRKEMPLKARNHV